MSPSASTQSQSQSQTAAATIPPAQVEAFQPSLHYATRQQNGEVRLSMIEVLHLLLTHAWFQWG